MLEQIPLIIVIATVLALWGLGVFLTRQSENLAPASVIPAVPAGKIFADGLHVEEMSNVLIKEAQQIINRQDERELTYFLARYRPRFIELEEYLADLRSQYFTNLGKPSSLASEADKFNAVNNLHLENAPSLLDMSAINSAQLRYLIEKNINSSNFISSDFMDRFGGIDFYDNFQVYTQLCGEHAVTIHARYDHQYRQQLEALTATGVVVQGRKIPLKERLEVLSFNQLKDMATELKVNKTFADKSEIAATLAPMPGSAVHLAMIHEPDDIFYIKAEPVDPKSIEDEYNLLNAYAKLLIGSLRNSFVSFDEVAIS